MQALQRDDQRTTVRFRSFHKGTDWNALKFPVTSFLKKMMMPQRLCCVTVHHRLHEERVKASKSLRYKSLFLVLRRIRGKRHCVKLHVSRACLQFRLYPHHNSPRKTRMLTAPQVRYVAPNRQPFEIRSTNVGCQLVVRALTRVT